MVLDCLPLLSVLRWSPRLERETDFARSCKITVEQLRAARPLKFDYNPHDHCCSVCSCSRDWLLNQQQDSRLTWLSLPWSQSNKYKLRSITWLKTRLLFLCQKRGTSQKNYWKFSLVDLWSNWYLENHCEVKLPYNSHLGRHKLTGYDEQQGQFGVFHAKG